ncbi:hypothetical protein B9T10_02195 [Wohlfahrtiimonas chitiniclastica]|nr:hypothetical protein B9T10_02195 [Wohlfahrtiimonas chitiniclastica]
MKMERSQRDEVVRRFIAETGAKPQGNGKRYKNGICPSCQKKKLWIFGDDPWKIQCDSTTCGYEISARDRYPDIFENFSKRYAHEMAEDGRAIAKAYLREARGFNTTLCDQFTQETFFDYSTKVSTPTVRFPMPGDGYWERLIENLEKFEQKAHFKKGYSYKGLAWHFNDLDVSKINELWVVEGIFDAIALRHHNIHAISAMSANNFPEHTLTQIYQKNPRLNIVIALDSDEKGKQSAIKWLKLCEKIGFFSDIRLAITNDGDDWNDKHIKEQLDDEDIETYLHHGAVLSARSPMRKAYLMYQRYEKQQFFLEFNFNTYWVKVDVKSMLEAINKNDEDEETAFKSSCTITEIANCVTNILYAQKELDTNELFYFLEVVMKNKRNKDAFSPKQLSSAGEFKARVMNTVSGATFTGETKHLDQIYRVKTSDIKDISTVPFLGYAKELGAYIFPEFAVKNGRVYKLNKEEYFELPGNQNIKTTFSMPEFDPSMDYQNTWHQDFIDVFGQKGLTVLAFWLGSLFVEQLRDVYKGFPFLELTGEAGAGKSTILQFMWKLSGRGGDYEGVNPNNGSKVGYFRTLSQVANLPTVMIECEGFNLEDLKSLYNGGYLRTTGQKNNGNNTNSPKFRGSLILSQNERAITAGSRDNLIALLSRLVYVHFDTSNHTSESRIKARRLEQIPMDELSGFLVEALKNEDAILKCVHSVFEQNRARIMALEEVQTTRIGLTHGLMLSLLQALKFLMPIPEHTLRATEEYICRIAVERDIELKQDHPILEQFWEVYEYLNTEGFAVNHSRNDEYIAINLNQFYGLAAEMRQQLDDIKTVKKMLPHTSRHKYIEHNKVVNSKYNDDEYTNRAGKGFGSLRCYIFHKGKG